MRNLKRALSLTLASVMLLGMMVVGVGAASYPDVSEEDNIEAIEVLQAVQVMRGDDKGNFNPDSPVTRSEMAVVMALLLDLDYQYYEATCPFTDVPAWARPYVGACYANGIVSGYNATTYGSNDSVTPVQAASMMMRALGYFQYASDYEGGFETATVRQGTRIGIFTDVGSSATAAMTRNQVAKMALNALKCTMVDAEKTTADITVGSGDTAVTINGQVNYVVRTSSERFAAAINDAEITGTGTNGVTGYTIELGEQLYNGDLKLYDKDRFDDFGRPARIWEYDGEEIGSYAKTELLKAEYTGKVTGKMLYELLGSSVISDSSYNLYVSIDGNIGNDPEDFDKSALTRTNDDAVGGTGNGTLTQVYRDGDDKDIYVTIINTYLAIADSNYNEKKDEASLKVYALEKSGKLYSKDDPDDGSETTLKVSGDDFVIADVKEDDKFLVTVANGEIKSMIVPEVLSGETITSHKTDKYVVAGQQYDYATTAQYDAEVMDSFSSDDMKEVTYNIVLDQYGYLIGLERNETVDQYVFLTGIDDDYSYLSKKNVPVNIIHLDGTMETVTMNTGKSDDFSAADKLNFGNVGENASQANTWCTYSVDSNGIYTLKMVKNAISTDPKVKVAQSAQDASGGDIKINSKNISLNGGTGYARVHGNDDTVYINVDMTNIMVSTTAVEGLRRIVDDVATVTTGVANVDLTVKDIGTTENIGGTDYKVVTEGTTKYIAAANEVYTLYKDNGTIIAVVTLEAEDNGTAAHYAYINSNNIDHRDYDAEAKEYSFYREAIVDGEFVMLKEVSDDSSSDYLANLSRGNWYEILYNSDDEVRGYREVTYPTGEDGDGDADDVPSTTKTSSQIEIGIHFMANANYVANQIDKTFILNADYNSTTNPALKYSAGTLYTGNDTTKGVYVSPNAKVVVFTDTYDESYETSGSNMATALNQLVDKDHFKGFVNAVIGDDGIATVVIIDERNVQQASTYSVTFEGEGVNNVTIAPASLTNIPEGGTASFTVTAKRGFVLDSVQVDGVDVPVVSGKYTITGITENITVTITTSEDANVLTDAVAVLKADGTEFAVFYKDGTTAPTGTGLANLLIEAAEDAGYTGVEAGIDENGKWALTGSSGKIRLSAAAYDPSDVIASYVGTVDNNTEVYVDKTAKLDAIGTFGKSSLPEGYLTGKGTLVKADNMGGGGSAIDTDYLALNDSGAGFADAFVLETGYVKVSGTDLTANNKAIPMGADYTVPKATDFGTAGKGTGMTYKVGSTGTVTYIDYSTNDTANKIPAKEVKDDITLTKDYVQVVIALDESLQDDWQIDTAATDTTKFVKVGGTDAVKINLIEKVPTAGKATVKNTSTYDAAATGMTAVSGATFAAGTHDADNGKTVLNITAFAATDATGTVTITVKTIDLDT